MTSLLLPSQLRDLLSNPKHEAAVLELVQAVGTMLEENVMPFFPAYTDHGAAHVEGVLDSALRLIPDEVWAQKLLTSEDAVVLACSAMLHDLAMHVREPGFVQLVQGNSPFTPCLWFSDPHPGRSPDRPWAEHWADFQREARHFGPGQLDLILGAGAAVPTVAHETTLDPSNWTTADRLLIGEFLRRHHARLAHEIARFGFPGLDSDTFPVLAELLPELGEGVGAVARSHNESIRLMQDYLQYLAPGSKRPKGALLLYEMALLRVADYLQVDSTRAPLLLLRLKDPQSPLSVEEWKKHGAVSSLSWDHSDPHAIYVSISPRHGLRTHLALGSLFADLQREMDTCSAVLDVEFGIGELSALSLKKGRVLTDLNEPSLHEQLPYVPQRAALRSDPDLFRLVIGDLYGRQPAVAGRELIQNAVDAVRARRGWESDSGQRVPDSDLRQLESDVVVEIDEREDEECVLRVSDRGIGMPPEVVVDYFLQAGASFGLTPAEREDMDDKAAIRALKTGRFGVGAFAAFLLGPEIRVTTRHATAARGINFRAKIDEDLVELDWIDAPVGTEVEVPFDASTLPFRDWNDRPLSPFELLEKISSFYRLRDPAVTFAHRAGGGTATIEAPADVPKPEGRLPDRWRKIDPPGFDGVLWQVPKRRFYPEGRGEEGGELVHNGILIHDPKDDIPFKDETAYDWSDSTLYEALMRPSLAVFDSRHLTPVSLHRYGLGDRRLPFEEQLLESIGLDLVAHALEAGTSGHPIQGAGSHGGIYSRTTWMPLLPSLLAPESDPLFVLWVLTVGLQERGPWDSLTKAFFQGRGSVPWQLMPRRATQEISGITSDSFEQEGRKRSLDMLGITAMEWASWLDCEILGTVVVEKDGVTEYKGSLVRDDDRSYPGWRGSNAGDSRRNGGVFLWGDEPFHPAVEEILLEAVVNLRSQAPTSSFGITAFGSMPGPKPDEPLAKPWIRYLEGGVERSGQRRKAQAEKVLAEAPDLRPLVSKWRRLLDS